MRYYCVDCDKWFNPNKSNFEKHKGHNTHPHRDYKKIKNLVSAFKKP